MSYRHHPDEHGHWDVSDIAALLYERDALRAEKAVLAKDAARWRWARQDRTLWEGTYCFGISEPEEADEVVDAELEVVEGKS